MTNRWHHQSCNPRKFVTSLIQKLKTFVHAPLYFLDFDDSPKINRPVHDCARILKSQTNTYCTERDFSFAIQKSSLPKQLQQYWDVPEYQLKSLLVILSGLCIKLLLTKAINFHKFVVKSHLCIELYFHEHTFAAFYINLKKSIITYISSSDLLSHSVLIVSLKNTTSII